MTRAEALEQACRKAMLITVSLNSLRQPVFLHRWFDEKAIRREFHRLMAGAVN